ncbi:Fas-associated factor [Thalictrum thalictroides]|uniref:Fas-associated factor n=1 Tax=Thalictrum thalictroides TaxID=46969 RepID=A0A7J6VWV9_THATH|nr:Fas-associated factor [Thalictrum thalictroides]
MSFMSREGRRATDLQASYNGMVRRMVNLPRSILGGVSRAIESRINLMSSSVSAGRRDQRQDISTSFQRQQYFPDPLRTIPEEWAFLTTFEQQYGESHPFFYACKLVEALKIAEQEHKLLFMYFHSPEHPFTESFCNTTLSSELVVQFLDANFVSWGALASRGEGYQMAMEMRIETFPFCVVVVPASDSSIGVLQQVEGPVSPTELMEILQRTLEEQELAFGTDRKNEATNKRAEDRRLREEQDAAYLASLHIDSVRDNNKELIVRNRVRQNPGQEQNNANNNDKLRTIPIEEQQGSSKLKETVQKAQGKKERVNRAKDSDTTQILIRFPNGERREQGFQCNDTIRSIYKYIDSLNLPGIVGYRLISSFPRKVFGFEQMGMTLRDAGLYPRSSLFIELL